MLSPMERSSQNPTMAQWVVAGSNKKQSPKNGMEAQVYKFDVSRSLEHMEESLLKQQQIKNLINEQIVSIEEAGQSDDSSPKYTHDDDFYLHSPKVYLKKPSQDYKMIIRHNQTALASDMTNYKDRSPIKISISQSRPDNKLTSSPRLDSNADTRNKQRQL